MIKKVLVLLLLITIIPFAFASLKIEKTAVTDAIIADFNNSAIFNFKITNNGPADNFKISSLVGAYFEPSDSFTIGSGDTKELQVKVNLSDFLMAKPGIFNFKYRITGDISGVTEDQMQIKVASLQDAIEINSYNIALDSDSAIVYAVSRVGYDFTDIKADFHSSFFDFSKVFSLGSYEKKEFEIHINKEVIKKLIAGDYILSTNLEINNVKSKTEQTFKFTEKANIESEESKLGFLIRTYNVEKTNIGNLPMLVQVKLTKNIISRLFSTFNIEPSTTERSGFFVHYTFQKEIKPSEVYAVKVTTNWFYPLILIILLIIIGSLIKFYTSSDLIIKKHASFVRTKGGEFALKITLRVKAKKFAERIKVIDKLPALVKIYEKFAGIQPSKVDELNKRIEWNIEALQAGEERILSYVVFSKIGVVGKFELPSCLALYEENGKMKETESNKVFLLTETSKSI